MATIYQDWYNENEARSYPFDEVGSRVADSGVAIPDSLIVDARIRFPSTYGRYLFVSSLSVTTGLVTATFLASTAGATDDPEPQTFTPIASVTVPRPVERYRPYRVTAHVPGVSGWVVFGSGAERQAPLGLYFSRPSQSLLAPRAAAAYAPGRVTSIGRQYQTEQLSGEVQLAPRGDLRIEAATRTIDGHATRVVLFRMNPDLSQEQYVAYAGPCGKRPGSGTCDRQPIVSINGVQANCDFDLELVFMSGGLALSPFDVYAVGLTDTGEAAGTLVVEFPLGMADVCPGRVDPLPIDIPLDPETPDTSSSSSAGVPSSSLAGCPTFSLPYEDSFTSGLTPRCFWDERSGLWYIEVPGSSSSSGIVVYSSSSSSQPVPSGSQSSSAPIVMCPYGLEGPRGTFVESGEYAGYPAYCSDDVVPWWVWRFADMWAIGPALAGIVYYLRDSDDVLGEYMDSLTHVSVGGLLPGACPAVSSSSSGESSDHGVIGSSSSSSSSAVSSTVPSSQVPPSGPVRNVILLVGEGLGPAQAALASYFRHGAPSSLLMQSLTYSATLDPMTPAGWGLPATATPDPASNATALATGVDVPAGIISCDQAGGVIATLLEQFKDVGRRTGIVTNASILADTPSAFFAHGSPPSPIARAISLFEQAAPDVVLGARDAYDSSALVTYSRAHAAGYSVVSTRYALAAVPTNTQRLSGQFGAGVFPYNSDPLGWYPSLAEMTTKALEVLSHGERGFLLVVDNAMLGHAAAANDTEATAGEVLGLDDALAAAMTWAAGREDTLIVVLGSHEIGGLALSGASEAGSYPEVTWVDDRATRRLVPCWATGYNADRVCGYMPLRDIFQVIQQEVWTAPCVPVPSSSGPSSRSSSSSSAVPMPTAGLFGGYFSNAALTAPRRYTRVDPGVEFNWGSGAPAPGIPSNNFSIRWTGYLTSDVDGTFDIKVTYNDSVRVWLDFQKIIDDWGYGNTRSLTAPFMFTAGRPVPVIVEYRDATGTAEIQLAWNASGAYQVIPSEALTPADFGDREVTPMELCPAGLVYTLGESSVEIEEPFLRVASPVLNGKYQYFSGSWHLSWNGSTEWQIRYGGASGPVIFSRISEAPAGQYTLAGGIPSGDLLAEECPAASQLCWAAAEGSALASGTMTRVAGLFIADRPVYVSGVTPFWLWWSGVNWVGGSAAPGTSPTLSGGPQLAGSYFSAGHVLEGDITEMACSGAPRSSSNYPLPSSSNTSSTTPSDFSMYYGLFSAFYAGQDLVAPRLGTEVTPTVSFVWGSPLYPRPDWLPADNWSARIMGYVIPDRSETVTFRLAFQWNDSVRMWVNGTLLVDTWDTPNTPTGMAEGSVTLEEGYPYPIIIEYKDLDSSDALSLFWSSPGMALQPVPSRCLRPADFGDKAGIPDESGTAYAALPLVLQIRGSAGFDVSTCVLTRVDESAWIGRYVARHPDLGCAYHVEVRLVPVSGRWTIFATTEGAGGDFQASTRVFSDTEARALPPFLPCAYRAAYPEPDTPWTSSSSGAPEAGFTDDFLTVHYSGLYWRPVSGAWHLESPYPAPAPLTGANGEAWLFECQTPASSSSLGPGWCPPPDSPYVSSSSSLVPSTFVPTSSEIGIPPSHIDVEMGGLWAAYYASPGQAYPPVKVRKEPGLNITLSRGHAPISEIPSLGYSMRWVGYIRPEFSETYTLYLSVKGMATLRLAGEVVINTGATDSEVQAAVALQAGELYYVVINFDAVYTSSRLVFSWSSASLTKEVVPYDRLGYALTPQYEERLLSVVTTVDVNLRQQWWLYDGRHAYGVNPKAYDKQVRGELLGVLRGPWNEAGDLTYSGYVDLACQLVARGANPVSGLLDETQGWDSAQLTLEYNRAVGWWIFSVRGVGFNAGTTLAVAFGPGSAQEMPTYLPYGNFSVVLGPSTGGPEADITGVVVPPVWAAANCPPCMKAVGTGSEAGTEFVAYPPGLDGAGYNIAKAWVGSDLQVEVENWCWKVTINGTVYRAPRRGLTPQGVYGAFALAAGGVGDSHFPGSGITPAVYDMKYSGCPPDMAGPEVDIVVGPKLVGATLLPYYGEKTTVVNCENGDLSIEAVFTLTANIYWIGNQWHVHKTWDAVCTITHPDLSETVVHTFGEHIGCDLENNPEEHGACTRCTPPQVEYSCHDIILPVDMGPTKLCPSSFDHGGELFGIDNTFVPAGTFNNRMYFVMEGARRWYLWSSGSLDEATGRWRVGEVLGGTPTFERWSVSAIGDYSPAGNMAFGVCPPAGTSATELCPVVESYEGYTASAVLGPASTFIQAEGYVNGAHYYMSIDPTPWYLYRTEFGAWAMSVLLDAESGATFIKVPMAGGAPEFLDTDNPAGVYREVGTDLIGPTVNIGWCPGEP